MEISLRKKKLEAKSDEQSVSHVLKLLFALEIHRKTEYLYHPIPSDGVPVGQNVRRAKRPSDESLVG